MWSHGKYIFVNHALTFTFHTHGAHKFIWLAYIYLNKMFSANGKKKEGYFINAVFWYIKYLTSSFHQWETFEYMTPRRAPKFTLLSHIHCLACLLALFLLDNRLEVYLWQRGQPEQTESSASAWSCWHAERRCAMQTALQYCKGTRRLFKMN